MAGKKKSPAIPVKHDPVFGLAPLFRPLQKGERARSKLDLTIADSYREETLRFTCHEALSDDDQELFFAVLSLCTSEERSLILPPTPETEDGQRLRTALFAPRRGKAKAKALTPAETDTLMTKTSEYELLRLCGTSVGGSGYEMQRDTLHRLSTVNIRVQSEREDYSMGLLRYHVDTVTGMVHIAINTRSADAILGRGINLDDKGRFTFIDLADHRSLSSAPAKILHGWLCSWLGQGKKKKISLEKLASHIYPNLESVKPTSQRQYRSKAKKAVSELEALGWKVDVEGRGAKAMATIRRPKG